MAIKAATQELRSRINKAASMIGRGVNQNKPDVELEGRRQSALAHIENQILLGRHLLTSEEAEHLAKLLFSLEDNEDNEDYTADAVETNAEALSKQHQPVTGGLAEDDDDIA